MTKWSLEARARISLLRKGKKRGPTSEETKRKIGYSNSGKRNYKWKGDRYINKEGYVVIHVGGKAVFEHRNVMEQHIGRKLLSSEIVHHINEIRTDNRIKNLQLLSMSKHFSVHGSGVPKLETEAREIYRKLHSENIKKLWAEGRYKNRKIARGFKWTTKNLK